METLWSKELWVPFENIERYTIYGYFLKVLSERYTF